MSYLSIQKHFSGELDEKDAKLSLGDTLFETFFEIYKQFISRYFDLLLKLNKVNTEINHKNISGKHNKNF